MKNRQEKKAGFVMVIIIVMIALVTVEMFALTGGSNTILFQADNAYLEAVEQNLIASGLAWAEKNIKQRDQESVYKPVILDTFDMSIPRSTLTVTVSTPRKEGADIQIESSVSRNRQSLRHKKKYRIKL